MSFKKVSAATIITLSLAACSNNQPNDTPSITSSSNGIQKNNGNSADNNSNTSNNNSNTSGNNSNTSGNNSNTSGNNSNTSGNNSNTSGNNSNTSGNNSNTSGNNSNTSGNNNSSANATPRVDFSVSYEGLKSNANEAVQHLAKEFGVDDAALQSYTVKLGNQTSKGKELNLSGYPLKKLALNQDFQETAIARAEGKNYTIIQSGKAHIYRQNYSLIAGINPTKATLRGPDINKSENLDDTYILIKGQTTQTLPTSGKFDYSGIASDGASKGKLAYSVDFDSRKGSGKITGVGSDINLHEASIREGSYTNEIDNTVINGHGIEGSSNRGSYRLGFFGPDAEEIVGTVDDRNNGEIGFAGSR